MNARRNVFEHRAGNRTVICKHQQAGFPRNRVLG